MGGDLVMKVGGKLYRLCPAGVQELGEQGYKQVYKAVKQAEEKAFVKMTIKDEARFGGRSIQPTTREKLFGTKDVAPSRGDRVRQINGRMPINHDYAGKAFLFDKTNLEKKLKDISDLKKREDLTKTFNHFNRIYPQGVPFTGTGHPDFSRYAKKKVEFNFSGDHYRDFKEADRLAGLGKRPKTHTWHHHEDGKTMLLIPRDLHHTVKHTGGVAKELGK